MRNRKVRVRVKHIGGVEHKESQVSERRCCGLMVGLRAQARGEGGIPGVPE